MKEESQKQVWNNIAKEWHQFKQNPGRGVEDFLKNKTGKILDLGSGSGRHLIKTKGKLYLVDFSSEMIKLAKQKAKKEKIEAEFFVLDVGKEKLPFPDNFFDYAICIAVLHCLNKKSQKNAVKELYRVMKPKSESLIVVWNINSKRFKNSPKEKYIKWRDKGERYYYLFDEKEIYSLFQKVGFKIKEKIDSQINIPFVCEKL
jgi:ubiquinone/menaquinone biosynthesis C-methylase UbiE